LVCSMFLNSLRKIFLREAWGSGVSMSHIIGRLSFKLFLFKIVRYTRCNTELM